MYLSQQFNILLSSLKGLYPCISRGKTSPCTFSRDQKRMDLGPHLSKLANGIIVWKYLESHSGDNNRS